MSKKWKNVLLALLMIAVGFCFFAAYTFGAHGITGIIAMCFVFGGVAFFTKAFTPDKKAESSSLYRAPKKQNDKPGTAMCSVFLQGRDPVERARARETKNHPLCGWSQSVKRKNAPSSIM